MLLNGGRAFMVRKQHHDITSESRPLELRANRLWSLPRYCLLHHIENLLTSALMEHEFSSECGRWAFKRSGALIRKGDGPVVKPCSTEWPSKAQR